MIYKKCISGQKSGSIRGLKIEHDDEHNQDQKRWKVWITGHRQHNAILTFPRRLIESIYSTGSRGERRNLLFYCVQIRTPMIISGPNPTFRYNVSSKKKK
ncbi:BA75_00853T0 [Komagataella pastoris]|uniref:BA75_00853T0 n=1 Tax=Komagataella pastoris TaxID=4922 RepID=A0A1B2J729_PICPA|nr:BA75_00853T0 [Komagataella pastoris]